MFFSTQETFVSLQLSSLVLRATVLNPDLESWFRLSHSSIVCFVGNNKVHVSFWVWDIRNCSSVVYSNTYLYVYMAEIPFRIISMVESGLILKWYKDYSPKERKCDKSLSSIRHHQANLEATKGPFIALAIGMTIATISVILEFCVATLKKLFSP